jgi:uncharacterized protein YkwD
MLTTSVLRIRPGVADIRGVRSLRTIGPLLLVAVLAVAARATGPHPVVNRKAHVTDRYDVAACGPVKEDSSRLTGARGRAMILCLLNFERRAHGLVGLRENPLLDTAAQRHSADMVARHFFEHENPDGVAPQQRIEATGYAAPRMTGENIAWGEDELGSPAAIMDGWMHSPHHRDNILRPEFTEVGTGIARGGPPARKHILGHATTYANDFGG